MICAEEMMNAANTVRKLWLTCLIERVRKACFFTQLCAFVAGQLRQIDRRKELKRHGNNGGQMVRD
jgi:hypothetical protein